MTEGVRGDEFEARLDRWKSRASGGAGVDPAALGTAEDALRAEASALMSTGLSPDEAFLVALTRLAQGDAALRASARAYADDLLAVPDAERAGEGATAEFLVMLGCAAGAALAIKLPALFGLQLKGSGFEFYALNLSFFVLPFLLVFLAWVRRPPRRHVIAVSAIFAAGAVFANAYPFVAGGSTQILTAIHLPIALWLVLGVVAVGGDWLSVPRRMEYARFTGEWFITWVLIALGGAVLSALTVNVFGAVAVNTEWFVSQWMVPCGAAAAVLVAAWLVEGRRNLVGGLAPMLARVFTPLFAVMLLALLVGVIASKGFVNVEREVLILLDLLLVVVVALMLYGISARDPQAAPGLFDRVQLVLVACALAVDVFALANIAIRLNEFGFSPNRTAALGLNLILLVNLAVSAVLQIGFLRSRRSFAEVEQWQMLYLPVYAAWAAIVVVVFPPLFRFA